MWHPAVRSGILMKAASGVNDEFSRALAGPLSIMLEFSSSERAREVIAPYLDKVSVCMHVSRVHRIMAQCPPVKP